MTIRIGLACTVIAAGLALTSGCTRSTPPLERANAALPPSVPRAPREGRSPDDRLLFVFVGGLDGRKGLIDTQGRIVVEPEYAWARSSTEGRAMVEKQGKRGFVDGTGRIVIEPTWDDADPFSEGLALVATGIEYQSHGRANLVSQEGGKRGYIDRTGTVVIEPRFDDGRPFSGGVAWVLDRERWGLIDRTGRYAIEPRFEVEPRSGFAEGLCPVWLGGAWNPDESVEEFGYVDTTGATVFPARFRGAGSFSEGRAPVIKGGHLGFIDRTGAFAIEPRFDWRDGVSVNTCLPSFSDGLAAVSIHGRYGFIDKAGQVVIEPRFETGGIFNGGLETYDTTVDFSEGLAAVVVGEKTGFIDKDGRMVIEPRFRRVDPFDDGIARVEFEFGEWGYIRRDGSVIWDPLAGHRH